MTGVAVEALDAGVPLPFLGFTEDGVPMLGCCPEVLALGLPRNSPLGGVFLASMTIDFLLGGCLGSSHLLRSGLVCFSDSQ